MILPVHNRQASIGRAVDSVLAQTWGDLELIVVDDGSTDGTPAMLEAYGDRVTVLTQPQLGAYPARNRALAEVRGDWVAFMDSDDAWFPDKLVRQAELAADPDVGLIFADAVRVGQATADAPRLNGTQFEVTPPYRGHVADRFVFGNFVPTCTAMVRKACLQEIGGFSETGRLSADYLAWLRVALRHKLDYVRDPLAEYTVHAEGISFDLERSLAARIALFGAELALIDDPSQRRILQRLVCGLGFHLLLAAGRGRTAAPASALRMAQDAISQLPLPLRLPFAAEFAFHHAGARVRRIFG